MSDKTEREKRRRQRLTEETEAQAQARRKRLVQLVSLAVFAAIAAVVVAIVVSQSQSSGEGGGELVEVKAVDSLLKGIPQAGTVLGDPKAKTTLLEYGDLQCPICKAYSEEVLPQVIEGQIRNGEAKLDFRNFTILGPESAPAAAAALAAGEQGRGWNFIELFYRNQGEERSGYVTDSFLTSIAKGAGVPDIARWNSERHSKRLLREVSRTTAQAESYGFEGTPSFVVKGPNGTNPLGTPGSAETIETALREGG
jgi:protein-disulfide isomerase